MRSVGLVALVVAAIASGCASIMQGTTQSVGISSSPTGAQVTVNGNTLGQTPLVADLKRKDQHIVRIQLPGYQPYETTLSRGVSGWVAGNIVFGGLIGLAVDAITGGMYKLTPEQISATMMSGQGALNSDQLYITVVLQPSDQWELIGFLESE